MNEIIIKIKLNEKEVKKIIYKVDFKEEVSPEDLRIARDFEGHELTLGATWPPGTERRILMIKAFMYSPKFR